MNPLVLADPGSFYQTTSGILVVILIASILELRTILGLEGDLTFIQKMSATILLISLVAGGIFLVNVPAAVLGHFNWFTDRDRLVRVTALVGAIPLLGPAASLIKQVWGPRDSSDAPVRGPHTQDHIATPPASRWLVALVVVIGLRESLRPGKH